MPARTVSSTLERMTVPAKRNEQWIYDLAFEVALGYFDEGDLKLKFDISDKQLTALKGSDDFRKAVTDFRRQIDDAGDAFRLRAKKAAELALDVTNRIVHDDSVDAATRIKAVDQLVRYAGWGKEDGADKGVTINIKTYEAGSGVTIEAAEIGGGGSRS